MIEFEIGDSSETVEEKSEREREEAQSEEESLELMERWADDECVEDAMDGAGVSETSAAIALAVYEELYREEFTKKEQKLIS